MASPHLPPELEYTIFLLAYRIDDREAKNLILVAKRVFEWLIPHVFSVVRLSSDPYPIEFNESTYQKYGHHVRHLVIDSNDLRSYLHLFPNVTNLAFWSTYEPAYLPFLLQLPLERISIGSTMSSPDVFELLAKVTHLDFIPSFSADDMGINRLLYLPNLTHLCVLRGLPKRNLKLFLDRERCPRLSVVAIWDYGNGAVELDFNGVLYPRDDDRVVRIKCMSVVDWTIGAKGGLDMWKLAESVVAGRGLSIG